MIYFRYFLLSANTGNTHPTAILSKQQPKYQYKYKVYFGNRRCSKGVVIVVVAVIVLGVVIFLL